MSIRHYILLIVVLGVASCAKAPPYKVIPFDPAKMAPVLKDGRWTVGSISFALPDGWKKRPGDKSMLISFSLPTAQPMNPSRMPGMIGVRAAPSPGVSIDVVQREIEKIMAQSVEKVNAGVQQAIKSDTGNKAKVSINQKSKFSTAQQDIDGVRVLTTEFVGQLATANGIKFNSKTYGLQIVRPDAMYSVNLTFRAEEDAEMAELWKNFLKNVQIKK